MIVTKHNEVRYKTSDPKRMLNMYLPARVLRTWKEDFIDEDTNEVISIERNEVLYERGTFIDQDVLARIKFDMEAGDIKEVEVSNQLRMAYEVENNCVYPFEAQAMIGTKKVKFLLHANDIDRVSLVLKDYIELNYRDPFWIISKKQYDPCVILTDKYINLKVDDNPDEEIDEEEELTEKDKKFYQIETKISCENADGAKWETSQQFVVHTFDTNRAMLMINAYLQNKEKEAKAGAEERGQTYMETTHIPVIESAKPISIGCFITREFSSAYFKKDC